MKECHISTQNDLSGIRSLLHRGDIINVARPLLLMSSYHASNMEETEPKYVQ
jgi:hypothetical protein